MGILSELPRILAAGMLGILGYICCILRQKQERLSGKRTGSMADNRKYAFTYCIGSMVLSSMAMYFSVAAESVYLAYLIPLYLSLLYIL